MKKNIQDNNIYQKFNNAMPVMLYTVAGTFARIVSFDTTGLHPLISALVTRNSCFTFPH